MGRPTTRDLIVPLATGIPIDPARVLRAYRDRFHALPWATQSPDTLIGPVWSPPEALAAFEAQIRALYTAHLKIAIAVATGHGTGARWSDYVAPYQRIRAFCFDWPVIGARAELDPSQLAHPDALRWLYGRPDVVLTASGPRVVETNFDTAVGGFERPDDVWQLARELFEPPSRLAAGGPIAGLARYFVDLAAGAPLDVLWIMKEGDDLRREYRQLTHALDRPAHGVSHRVFHAGDRVELDDLTGRAVLHRACANLTVNRDRDRFAALLAPIAQRISGCTVPVELSHLESKLFLAWLSDPDARPTTLTADERAAIDALVPWTRLVKLLTPDDLHRVERDRGDFVLKKTDSYQALDVIFGCNVSDEQWRDLLAAKAREADDAGGINVWIVQERVRPQEFSLVEYTDDGARERRSGLSCCPYVLGGRLRGVETWLTPFTPDHSMIHRMQYVAHFLAP